MKDDPKKAQAAVPMPKALNCKYVKSSQFRVVGVDGVVGGLTPQGLIQLSLFNERFPIPAETDYEVNPDGSLGAEIKKGKAVNAGFERELEVSALLRLDTAKALVKWLQTHITQLEAIQQQLKQQGAK